MSQAYSKRAFSGSATLEVSSIECIRGYRHLFSDVTFTVTQSSVTQITGPNGSGKTSLLRILAGLRSPEQGSVSWNPGDSTPGNTGIFYLGHRIALNGQMTVTENLMFLEHLETGPSSLDVDQALDHMGVGQLADTPCFLLSAGQKQRAALSAMLRSTARLWLLDEPVTALDTSGVCLVEDAIGMHANAGGIALFTSHQPIRPPGVETSTYTLD